MIYLLAINTLLLLVVILQRGIKLSTLKEIREAMATQEERLQAIEAKLQTVVAGIETLKQQLADLKSNNPAIEDEITAIEGTVNDIGTAITPPEPTT